MAKNGKRLDRLTTAIHSTRPAPGAVNDALSHFLETGELPIHQEAAKSVVKRTLQMPHRVSLREQLLHEATSDLEYVRKPARFVLTALVGAGQNIASRNFLDEDMDHPTCGSVGLHLLGWPEILVRPPYEDQAVRVLLAHEALRRRLAGDDYAIRNFARDARDFMNEGKLPTNARDRSAVISYTEFLALHRILGDEEDAEVLAAFERVGTAPEEERDRAIEALQGLARDGRIP